MNIDLVELRPANHGRVAAPSPILVYIIIWYSDFITPESCNETCILLHVVNSVSNICILKVGEHCVAFADLTVAWRRNY